MGAGGGGADETGALTDEGAVRAALGAGATAAIGGAALAVGGGAIGTDEERGSCSPLARGGRSVPHAPRGPTARRSAIVIALLACSRRGSMRTA